MSNDSNPKQNKENMVALRLNDEQMLEVKQWAASNQVSVSEVIRRAIEFMTKAKP